MGLYDSFLKDNGNDIQVKCFSSMGGFMDVFHKGDYVSTDISDSDFNILKEYGQNFNIYCYMTFRILFSSISMTISAFRYPFFHCPFLHIFTSQSNI